MITGHGLGNANIQDFCMDEIVLRHFSDIRSWTSDDGVSDLV